MVEKILSVKEKLKIKVIVNKNCYLKVLTDKDIKNNYVNWLNDYEITKYTEQKKTVHTKASIKKFVNDKLNSKADLHFGIFFKNEHIGNIKLGPINWEHLNSEISYFIGEKKYWGQGIASQVVKSLVMFAFEKIGLEKINAGYYKNNIASKKVFKKCGFLIEGERINNFSFEEERINSILVGIVKES